MKKICVVTAARSEYGLLKWIMKDIEESEHFELQLVVTGGHLLMEQGMTIDQIREDGFRISYIVDEGLNTDSKTKIAKSMGRMATGFADAFEQLKPDYLMLLGDRYELLAICSTAVVMNIPIIHISGGDVTEGAIDDGIRNAITMLAEYHFPGTEASAENIRRMRGSKKNIWVVGEPGLDSFYRESLMSREQLAEDLELDIDKKWVMMTYHSETKKSMDENMRIVRNCIESLIHEESLQIVVTYANADFGGERINEYLEESGKNYPDKIKVVPSLGSVRYLSIMKQVQFVIGNSSSGIVEAPFCEVAVINIGNRQKGRYQCQNIIQVNGEIQELTEIIKKLSGSFKMSIRDNAYWGDGHASQRIVSILSENMII